MIRSRSFKQRLSKVFRECRREDYETALGELEALRKEWPGNAQVELLWASLVQLQEADAPGLDQAKAALERAVELDQNSPAAPIELGHYLDAVEDDPRAAARAFAQGVSSARRLLIDGLLGQARALLQLDRRPEAIKCLAESLYLANVDQSPAAGRSSAGPPDIFLRDAAGLLQFVQLKGPFAMRIEELLEEVSRKRSA